MTGIGHNGGPTIEPGAGFRRLAWKKARRALLPTLPLEVVRVRVARAERLGVPYKTYASIRAASGRDIVAFLFSGNALQLRRASTSLPGSVADRLTGLDGAAARAVAVHAPADPEAVLKAHPGRLDHAGRAPAFTDSWTQLRRTLQSNLQGHGLPRDGVVLVSATSVETDWCGAAGLAGVIAAERFFHRN